jgi:hypothetical protein
MRIRTQAKPEPATISISNIAASHESEYQRQIGTANAPGATPDAHRRDQVLLNLAAYGPARAASQTRHDMDAQDAITTFGR